MALAACASQLPVGEVSIQATRDSVQAFSLDGRFSLCAEGQAWAGRIDWRHDGARDELLLSSPLGQGMAEMVSDSGGARLTDSNGSEHRAKTPDALLERVLGYSLSLHQLVDWARGRGRDGDMITLDALGRPRQLRHEDWRIDYEYDNDDRQALPGRLFAEREGVLGLRLRIDEWRALPSGE